MNKDISKKIIFATAVVFIASAAFSFFVPPTEAVVNTEEYTVLAPLPGTTVGGGDCVGTDCKADLKSYIPGLFKLIIGLAAVVAVAYIIYGGFLYITTDAIQEKSEGKAHITNAIYGLVMISIAWLILYTINPRLLKFELNIGALSVPDRFAETGRLARESNPCTDTTSTACLAEQAAEQRLPAGITLNQPCTFFSCPTRVDGLTQNTINNLGAMVTSCGCSLVITGGNEQANRAGSSDHVAGTAVDLRPNSQLDSYLKSRIGNNNPVPGQSYSAVINSRPAIVIWEPTGTVAGSTGSTGNHWHINFQ